MDGEVLGGARGIVAPRPLLGKKDIVGFRRKVNERTKNTIP